MSVKTKKNCNTLTNNKMRHTPTNKEVLLKAYSGEHHAVLAEKN